MPYGHSEDFVLTPWDKLPGKNGEEDGSWKNAMARYGHQRCPGLDYEDVCSESGLCAYKGACLIQHEKNRKTWEKQIKSGTT